MRWFRRRRRLWRDKTGGEEKNHIKRRVERQKVFSSPPAKNAYLLSKIFGIECFHDAEFETADFGEAFEAADSGVAGVGTLWFCEVIEHGMTVVGADWNLPVGTAFFFAADLFFADSFDEFVHGDDAFEVVGFKEVAFAVVLG